MQKMGNDQSQVNKLGDTALIWTCRNNNAVVALEILKHPDECNLNQADAFGETALSYAKTNNMTEVVKRIEGIYDNSLDNKKIDKDLLWSRISNKTCLFCGEKTKDSILYSTCCHVLISCDTCTPRLLNKKCPMCSSTDNTIKKAYLCS